MCLTLHLVCRNTVFPHIISQHWRVQRSLAIEAHRPCLSDWPKSPSMNNWHRVSSLIPKTFSKLGTDSNEEHMHCVDKHGVAEHSHKCFQACFASIWERYSRRTRCRKSGCFIRILWLCTLVLVMWLLHCNYSSKVTAPQDARKRLVLQVYLGLMHEFSAIHR